MRTAFSINLVWVSALAAVCLCATPLRNGAQDTPVPAGTAVPQWPKAFPAQLPTDGPSVHSRELQLIHSRDPEGGFGIRVAGKPMAFGLRLPHIAYSNHGQLIWLDLAQAANKRFVLRAGPNSLRVTLTCADADGAQWEIRQQFSAAAIAGAIEVRTEVKVDQNRAIIFLPMLMIFPGVGAFGETKGQGLFAGLEYLENEPSSSEADVVGHVRYPLAALVYGHVAENAARASENGRRVLQSFDPDGSVRYHARDGGLDLGKTHFTNEASGLTSGSVESLLEAAGFSGDRKLLEAALDRLRAMDKFRNGVPRGAQTWECPLHTPDILASAHLVGAYTLGYELSGETEFLDQARYWAWTGVPFVYLVNPTAGPIGPYGTIAVFGATHWQAPVWMGLPVQWCGLVYADALYRLQRFDTSGPWKQLADGITASGVQQSCPVGSNAQRQGLLPDSFQLRPQIRNDAAINPGTVQAVAARLL